MESNQLLELCRSALHTLCVDMGERSVGCPGNRAATRWFRDELASLGWPVQSHEFDALDWQEKGARLAACGQEFSAQPSPYANGCRVEAPLICISTLAELEAADTRGRLVLLHGEIAREQLMPRNFVFYNPEEHQRILAALDRQAPAAIICATGRNSAVAGGVYPFPLIEDGDFDIPSVFMTEEEGRRLLACCGGTARLESDCRRLPGQGWNVSACRGDSSAGRLVVTAHIDAKRGTPGAIDNASGVVVLLLLARLLKEYRAAPQVEILALNGEDYYAVPGQMLYLQQNQGRFGEILLNINIDGAGYHEGGTAVSFYGLPVGWEQRIKSVLAGFEGLAEGPTWVQGDHSIFIQVGRPALAVTSSWFSENMDSQDITHTPRDNIRIVNPARLVEIAQALAQVITSW